ncbi:hypothetical protein J6590_100967 [Homalodisca vitripennis]|nr:hypothetical protein J6590_100967 [Homalodisca vitripennis]
MASDVAKKTRQARVSVKWKLEDWWKKTWRTLMIPIIEQDITKLQVANYQRHITGHERSSLPLVTPAIFNDCPCDLFIVIAKQSLTGNRMRGIKTSSPWPHPVYITACTTCLRNALICSLVPLQSLGGTSSNFEVKMMWWNAWRIKRVQELYWVVYRIFYFHHRVHRLNFEFSEPSGGHVAWLAIAVEAAGVCRGQRGSKWALIMGPEHLNRSMGFPCSYSSG